MTKLSDVLAEYAHDRPFCGRMTKAGIPCPREANALTGRCSNHNPFAALFRAASNIIGRLADALADLPKRMRAARRYIEAGKRRQAFENRFIQLDPKRRPPALPAPEDVP